MTFSIQPLVPELWCSDFETSMQFYTDVVGFEVAQRRGTDPHACFRLQHAQIMIAHWTFDGSWEPWLPHQMEKPFGRGINLQFMVENVQDLFDRVVAAGVTPFRPLYDAEIWRTDCMDTRRQFMILDPDGYVLRFAQSIVTRPVTERDHERLSQQYGTGPI